MVLDPVRIEAHAFDLGPRPAMVLGTHSIIEDKFGPARGRVNLDGQHCRRSDEDSVFALFGHNK